MMNKQEQILVRITGQDRPGLTASIMGILAKYDAQILDIGQADIHSTLSLGILIRMDETNSGQVMKELLFKATELNVNIGFSPITDDEYEDWVGHQGKNRYILMVLGRQLEARQIEGATRILADQGLNIDSIQRHHKLLRRSYRQRRRGKKVGHRQARNQDTERQRHQQIPKVQLQPAVTTEGETIQAVEYARRQGRKNHPAYHDSRALVIDSKSSNETSFLSTRNDTSARAEPK